MAEVVPGSNTTWNKAVSSYAEYNCSRNEKALVDFFVGFSG